MEDCCAVCAEPLEWVAYGPCGHREVCSMCIARLRFVLNDNRCCICKQECPSVFVTKALGDYTKLIGDFQSLANQENVRKGTGGFWFESNTQAYFDDEEQFKLIKAMCRLYCSVCERAEEIGKDFVKKGYVFGNLDLLRRHLHVHKLQMCGLCLEGRKVFICEQKLYTKAQLDRHASKGDSLVDGTEEERGGFTGHPICDFCGRRFYGDNELYHHMSTEHYTCHICQRLRPGRYDYYRNYDDLEAHFRHDHALCEDSECLAKKFVVFTSEAELKRHNAMVHGGNMSRAQRNAALQIPVSFQFHRPRRDHGDEISLRRAGRGRGNYSHDQLSAAVMASIDSANLEIAIRESEGSETSCTFHARNTPGRDFPELSGPTASLGSSVIEAGSSSSSISRYLAAVSPSPSLEESAFPPLPGSKNARRKAKQRSQGPARSMAALLGGGQGRIKVLHSPDLRQPKGTNEGQPSSSLSPESISVSSQSVSNLVNISLQENLGTNRLTDSVVSGPGPPPAIGQGVAGGARSVPGEVPPSVQEDNGQGSNVRQLSKEEIRLANRALVEHIRAGLKGNERQYTAFKDVSSQFRKGEIHAKTYYKHVVDFGLSHLVPELARLCPDSHKQKDLLDAYKEGLSHKHSGDVKPPGAIMEIQSTRDEPVAQKAKHSIEMNTTGDFLLNSAGFQPRKERGGTSSDGDVEVLSKDGYRDAKGKTKVASGTGGSSSDEARGTQSKLSQVLLRATQPLEVPFFSTESSTSISPDGNWACNACTLENKAGTSHCAACGMPCPHGKPEKSRDTGSSEKRKKKTSKFQRIRLGDGSAAALLDSRQNPWGVNHLEAAAKASNLVPPSAKPSSSGVWKNGGGQKLVSIVRNNP